MIIGYYKNEELHKCVSHEIIENKLFINLKPIKRNQKIRFQCDNCKKIFDKNYYPEELGNEQICSNCKREKTNLEKYGVKNSFQHENTKKNLLKKYGVDSINKIDEVKEKKKNVFKERYGEENPWGFGKEKYKASIQEKYGVENPQQNKEIREKTIQTNIEKYGASSVLSDKKKMKESMHKKHGVIHSSYMPEVIEKRKDKHYNKIIDLLYQNADPIIVYIIKHKTQEKIEVTSLENIEIKKLDVIGYKCCICGKINEQQYRFKEKFHQKNLMCHICELKINNPFKDDEVKKKIKETKQERYGNASYTNRKKAKKTMYERYGEYYTNRSKAIKTNLEKYGTKHPNENGEVKKKIKETKQERYGDKDYNNREKYKETMVSKYGGTNVLNSSLKDTVFNSKAENAISRLNNVLSPRFSLEEWRNKKDKYLKFPWKCRECGTEFEAFYANGIIPRCPTCYPRTTGFSEVEKEVGIWLESLNIEDIRKNTKEIISPKELDIYLPKHKLAIEFNGIYWHSELQGKDKHYHINKTLKCQEQGIDLIHIFEDEWVDKQDIIKSIIKGRLGLSNKIYGRKCIVKEIDSRDALSFYEENHIQGGINSSINIGLFYEGELVSALSFAKPRFNKQYDYEITRFANKLDTSVIGGFSKMLEYFKGKYSGSIITYSDRRLFNGSIYLNNSFTKLESSNPSYYYTDYRNRYNRVGFQKHKLKDKLEYFDPNLTEWENMQLNGWDRIWDCGNSVFTLHI